MSIDEIIAFYGGVKEATGTYRFPNSGSCTKAFIALQEAFEDGVFSAAADCLWVISRA